MLLDHTGAPISTKGFNLDPNFLIPPRQLAGLDSTTKISHPYSQHSWVYACTNAIARNIAQLKIVFHDEANPEKMVADHPYIDLMHNPNPYMNGSDLVKFTILSLLLPTTRTSGGQCFWIFESTKGKPVNTRRGELPFEIYPFSDECIEPRQDTNKNLVGWNLRLPDGTKIAYGLEEVVRFKLLNPYDLTKGLSPMVSAKLSITGDLKADALNNRFLDNNASLGGILTTDKILADAQIKVLGESWKQQYGGVSQAGNTAILHSGLKYEQMARTHLEMAFMEQKSWTVDVIRAVYGVPKFAVGLYEDLNFATAEIAKKFFWEETLLPYCRDFWSTLNSRVVKWLDGGKKWVGTFDYSSVEALQDQYKDKIVSWTSMVDRGVPMDRAAGLLKIPLDSKGQDYMSQPLTKTPMVNIETGEVIGAPVYPTTPENTPKKIVRDVTPVIKITDDVRGFDALIRDVEADQKEADLFWADHVARSLSPGEKAMEPALKTYFFAQRNLIQDKIDAWARKQKAITKADEKFPNEEFLPNKKEEDEKLGKIAKPLYEAQLLRDTAKMQQEVGDLLNWDVESPTAKKIINDRVAFLKKINNTTFTKAGDIISVVLEKSKEDGLTTQQTAKELKKAIGKVYDIRTSQAKTIARTETGAISSQTRFAIMQSEEIQFHKWVSARDSKVRHDHAKGTGDDGIIIKVGDSFPNSGLAYPHAPGGAAEQCINCRCTTVASKKES